MTCGDICQRLSWKKKGLIIIENVLRHGDVVDKTKNDKLTNIIRDFNFYVKNDKNTEQIRLSTLVQSGITEINIESLVNADLIKNSTKKVKVFLDTDKCSKMHLKGINTSNSVKQLIESAGGSVEE